MSFVKILALDIVIVAFVYNISVCKLNKNGAIFIPAAA
jgi:hypothetical protein